MDLRGGGGGALAGVEKRGRTPTPPDATVPTDDTMIAPLCLRDDDDDDDDGEERVSRERERETRSISPKNQRKKEGCFFSFFSYLFFAQKKRHRIRLCHKAATLKRITDSPPLLLLLFIIIIIVIVIIATTTTETTTQHKKIRRHSRRLVFRLRRQPLRLL